MERDLEKFHRQLDDINSQLKEKAQKVNRGRAEIDKLNQSLTALIERRKELSLEKSKYTRLSQEIEIKKRSIRDIESRHEDPSETIDQYRKKIVEAMQSKAKKIANAQVHFGLSCLVEK